MPEIEIITAAADEIEINKRELAARLKTTVDFNSEILEKCKQRLCEVIDYKCAYIKAEIDLSQEDVCDFGFMKVSSKKLYRNLSGCKEAFVMAVTTGIAVDRLLTRLNMLSQAEHFITDGLSSAAIESFCDYACEKMSEGYLCANRFSPGYGDVSLETQKPLLKILNAERLLGITLNSAYLMTPVKSVTAIMGIKTKLG